MNLCRYILLFAMLLQRASPAQAPDKDLEMRRLDTLIDLAEAKRNCSRIKDSLDRLSGGKFDAAKDRTLERLSRQLDAAGRKLKELLAVGQTPSAEAAKRIQVAQTRVDSLRADVRLARESLQRYFQRELDRAQESVKTLSANLMDIQNQLDRPKFEPPKVDQPKQDQPKQVPTPPVLNPVNTTTATVVLPLINVNGIGAERKAEAPLRGATRKNKPDDQDYIFLPAGSFQMGCLGADKKCEKRKDELPPHEVILTHGFWIGTTEVTVGAYLAFSQATGHNMPPPSKTDPDWKYAADPISRVTYRNATDFCKWAGGRLPTEAEWEYAARAGTSTVFPWGDEADHERANFFGKSKDPKRGRDKFDELANVKSFPPNAWGLYDMLGNVAEFVADFYSPYPNGPVTDPKGPESGEERIIRGGSYGATPDQLRTSRRERVNPGAYANYIGFRCALDEKAPR